MQFDQESLEPLYLLNTGQAGSSFTFEVAQKNGIPFRLINRAKKKVEREKIRLDKTIASLQKERTQLREKADKLEKQQLESREGHQELLNQQKKIRERIESFQTLYDTNQKMLSFGRKTNELFNRFFQTGNKKQLLSEFTKWSLIEKTRFEEKKKERLEAEMLKKNDEKERPLSKRERTRINRQLKLEEQKKKKALKEIETQLIPEVEKVRKEKKKEIREKALDIEGYEFKVSDIVRLKDGNAKGSVEKIEKNIATINYGLFTAKADLDQLELVKKGK